MPWKEVSTMSQRAEFAVLSCLEGANMSALCRRFEISRETGYKWRTRFQADGPAGLLDRARRPIQSPDRTSDALEQRVLAARDQHPAWGGRKLRRHLQNLRVAHVPAASTITQILRRHDRLNAMDGAGQPRAAQRFERAAPNELWQMDFKGHFALTNGERCHPLTILDDHSRFSICLQACGNEQSATVSAALIDVFQRYGMPCGMLMDNGSPWGDEGGQPWTHLTAWLVRLGVRVSHGRPCHPQTQGKEERFHRTLQAEVLRAQSYRDLSHSQAAFDPWRVIYNTERPHEALGLEVPASRYRASARSYPVVLPAIEYAPDLEVRKVQGQGEVSFQGRSVRISSAFAGDPIGLRATGVDGVYEVHYCHQRVGRVDLRTSTRGGPTVLMARLPRV